MWERDGIYPGIAILARRWPISGSTGICGGLRTPPRAQESLHGLGRCLAGTPRSVNASTSIWTPSLPGTC